MSLMRQLLTLVYHNLSSTKFRSSPDSGNVPADWKRTNVRVINKKGVRNECGNYRSVRLTLHSRKLFTGILKEICEHLHKFNLILQSQLGIKSNVSQYIGLHRICT